MSPRFVIAAQAGTHGRVQLDVRATGAGAPEFRRVVGPGLRRDDVGKSMRTRWPRLVGAALVAAIATMPPHLTHAHPPSIIAGPAEKAIGEEIVDFRKRIAEAVKAKDAAKLREMYADTFQHTHTTAKSDNKDARIVAALAGDPVIETAPADDLVIRVHAGGWVAIANGTSPITSLADGQVYAVKWMAVYVRTEQSWQLAGSQATRVGK